MKNREPNALDAAKHVAMKLAEWGSYAILVYCLCYAWVATP